MDVLAKTAWTKLLFFGYVLTSRKTWAAVMEVGGKIDGGRGNGSQRYWFNFWLFPVFTFFIFRVRFGGLIVNSLLMGTAVVSGRLSAFFFLFSLSLFTL